MKILSQWLIIVLIVISARVAIGLMYKKNVQWWIVTYWIVLTFKNLSDFLRI